MKTGGKRVLVLYYHPTKSEMRLAVARHLRVLERSPRNHRILYYNAVFGAPSWLRQASFDVVVFHATFLCMRWDEGFHLWKWGLRWLNDLDCFKIAIPQDEYDHCEILDEWLYELGVNAVFTNFDEAHRKALYPLMSGAAKFYECLTGYIDEEDAAWYRDRAQPPESRPYDLVYRAFHLPYWFGSQGRLKYQIADVVAGRAVERGLRCDISTDRGDTVVGRQWLEFLGSGRAVIGCESGSSVLDRRGEIQAHIRRLCAVNPTLSFDDIDAVLPKGWTDYSFTALSPRHFEAVVTKTCQVLVEGRYNGVLQPHRHYLVLKRDLSNLDEVLERIKDPEALRAITEQAYEDVCRSGRYTYARFAEAIDSAIDEMGAPERMRATSAGSIVAAPIWRLVLAAARLSERLPRLARAIAHWAGRLWLYATLLKHPVINVRKVWLALTLILKDPVRRSVLVRYLTSAAFRERIGVRTLLSDLLMLELLKMVRDGSIPEMPPVRLTARYHAERRTLLFFSEPLSGDRIPEAPDVRTTSFEGLGLAKRVRHVIWDHSAIGHTVRYPLNAVRRVNLFLGSNGIYEFQTLAAGANSLPDAVRMALIPADGQPSGVQV